MDSQQILQVGCAVFSVLCVVVVIMRRNAKKKKDTSDDF